MPNATHDNDVLQLLLPRETPPITREGFGIPAIFDDAGMVERTLAFQSPAAATAARIAGDITQRQLDHLLGVYANLGVPERLVAGRMEAEGARIVGFTVGGALDGDYTIELGGVDYTFSATGSTASAIATNLAGQLNALPGYGATAAAGVVTLTGANGDLYDYRSRSTGSPITEALGQAGSSVASELTALKEADPSWFGFSLVSRDDAVNEAAALWAESNARLAVLQSSSADLLGSGDTDLGSRLKDLSLSNSALLYRADDDSVAAFRWLADRLSINLDRRKSIWSFVQLPGEASDAISDAQKINLQAKNVNYFIDFKGIPCTRPGVTPSGLKVDAITTALHTKARIDERIAKKVLDTVARQSFIGLDDVGLVEFEQLIDGVLRDQEAAGHFITGLSKARVPKYSELLQSEIDEAVIPYEFVAVRRVGAEKFRGIGYIVTNQEFFDAFILQGA